MIHYGNTYIGKIVRAQRGAEKLTRPELPRDVELHRAAAILKELDPKMASGG